MDKKMLLIMGGALAVALLVAILVSSKFSSKPSEGGSTTEILVAVRDLASGYKLKKEDLVWKSWLEENAYKGMYIKKEQKDPEKLKVFGEVLRRGLSKGEPVTTAAIVPESGGGSFLAASLEPGMRAMGVKVAADIMAGGFVTPGDFVDVILTYQVKVSGKSKEYVESMAQRYATQTVLQNARVMAVDQDAKEGNHDAKIAKTVTLEVTKEGAEILALSANMGKITLALRHLGEGADKTKSDKMTTDVHVIDLLQEVQKKYVRTQVESNSVRIYSGGDVQNVPVRIAPSSGGAQ